MDSELTRLMQVEREALAHYESLRGYPADDQSVALTGWQTAKAALEFYRAKQPSPDGAANSQ